MADYREHFEVDCREYFVAVAERVVEFALGVELVVELASVVQEQM